ncbi:hypothetical protein U1Q18_025651 [Sarracenia purpurea var. burkii]
MGVASGGMNKYKTKRVLKSIEKKTMKGAISCPNRYALLSPDLGNYEECFPALSGTVSKPKAEPSAPTKVSA